jgi:LysM repeat protein
MILNEFFNLPQVFEKDMTENSPTDPKSWMASIQQQHPDVRFVQAKMPGAPIIALVDGKKVAEFDTKKGMAEAKWNPYDQGDFPTDYNADDPAVGAGVGNAEKWQAMRSYYNSRFNIVGALQAQRGLMHPAHGTQHGVQAVMRTSLGKRVVKTFPNKEKAYHYAGVHEYEVVEIKDTGLATNPITLNVVLGHGEHKKQFSLQFPDMEKAQQWADRYHAEILGQSVAEGTGQYSKSWMASIEQQYPGVRFVQAKMPGAPIIALVNGKPVAQFDTKKGVAEGDNNSTHGMDRYVKPVRPGEINKVLQKGIDQRKAARERMQANIANLPTHPKKSMSESKRNKQRKLNEALLMEDPVYRRFKRVGQYIVEYKMSEKQILQVFADAEAGMTDKATGANRTFLGRGKDTTVDFAKDVAGALKGVWSGLQSSVPVDAVDTAWDQATDAMADLTGGQKGAVMDAITRYRNLAKQYPKTAGLAKAALVGIAGLATGGSLPAVAALVYGLDSAIKGDKFSDIVRKAGGAAATAWAGQAIHGGATQPSTGGPADTNALSNVNQMGDYNGDYVNMPDGSNVVSPLVAPTPDLATYTVQDGDVLSKIAKRFNTSVQELEGLNPQLAQASGATGGQGMNVDVIFPGQQITLPPGTPGMDVYAGGVGTNANTMADIARGQVPDSAISQAMAAKGQAAADAVSGRADNLANMTQQAGNAPIDYTQAGPISTDSLGHKLEYGIPVTDSGNFVPPNPNLPADELAKQTAAYNTWKADFMKRNPNIYIDASGNQMQIPGRMTLPAAVQESVKFKIIPASELIDKKLTLMSWKLNESVGKQSSRSVNLTTAGALTVFENIDRYRHALMEKVGVAGSTRPKFYRPDMAAVPATPDKKPGLIGQGLNWLDKKAKAVGSAVSNFGHQFTTDVTKEKLKMNWHQAGKPSDSDALAAWLVKQGVPQAVVTTVYTKMGIPFTAPAAEPATAQPSQTDALTKSKDELALMKKATASLQGGPALTPKELEKVNAYRTSQGQQPIPASAKPTAPAGGKFPGEDPQGPGYVGRREVARRQAARDAEAAKKPAAPNFAQQSSGYKSVNYAPATYSANMKPTATAKAPPAKNAAGGTSDQLSKDEYIKRIGAPNLPEAKKPSKEADYGPEYQAMVRRVGEKARAQEKARQQQPPKTPVRESRRELLKQIIQS